MYIENLGEIKAIGFDIDGTLYKAWRLNIRMWLHCVRYNQFFLKYGLVRRLMHKRGDTHTPDFEQYQAALMAQKLKCTPDEAYTRLQKIVYKGLSKYFEHIKPCKGVVDLIKDLKAAGYKIGVLSDFPPEQKGDIWGIKDMCDVLLGTEEAGALKPSVIPFQKFAKALEVEPEQILYIGNNHKYDIAGSKKSGMKSAWFISKFQDFMGKKSKIADITFSDYSQLRKLLLPEADK